MKSTTAGMDTHLAGEVTSLATLWHIVRIDAVEFFLTDHDQDIPFGGDIYESSVGFDPTNIETRSGMNVDNMNVTGFLDSSALTEQDLRAGIFNFAEVFITKVNWQDPDGDGDIKMRRGFLGEIKYSEARGTFDAELRGLTQLYSQRDVVELTSPKCRADLGDSRCGVPILPPVVAVSTAYALGDTVRGSPSLDGLKGATLLAPLDTDANDVSAANSAVGTLGSQAIIQTVQKKFGAGSAEFSPSGSVDPSLAFIEYPDIPAYTIGTQEFTAEAWVRFKDLTANGQTIISVYNNSGSQRAWFIRRNGGNLEFWFSVNGSTGTSILGAFAWAIDTDYHIAVTRDSSDDIRMFVDGVQVGSTSNQPGSIFDSTETLKLGKLRSTGFSDDPLFGFIDDARFIVGSAEYTTGFTPPTTAHTEPGATIAGLVTDDYEDVYYEVTVAGTTGSIYPNFDPVPGNTTVWGTATFTAREAFTRAIDVATVVDNRVFTVTFPNGADSREVDDWFKFGAVIWDTGNNVGLVMEVKGFVASSDQVSLFLDMPFTVQVGDTAGMYAGCDKNLSTCLGKFSNVINRRAEDYLPGTDAYLDYPEPTQ